MLSIYIVYSLAISFLGTYQVEMMHMCIKTHARMQRIIHISSWKEPKCPSVAKYVSLLLVQPGNANELPLPYAIAVVPF